MCIIFICMFFVELILERKKYYYLYFFYNFIFLINFMVDFKRYNWFNRKNV